MCMKSRFAFGLFRQASMEVDAWREMLAVDSGALRATGLDLSEHLIPAEVA
jgi:hypothetical protein